MKHLGTVLATLLGIVILAGLWFYGVRPLVVREGPMPKKHEPAVIQNKTTPYEWPNDARYAVCSADGRAVALLSGRTIVLIRDGKEVWRNSAVNALNPLMALSPDGSRFGVHCIWRREILILDTKDGRELMSIKSSEKDFVFNSGGDQIVVHVSDEVTKRYDILSPAHPVSTQAICSDNGRTVAIVTSDETQFFFEGKFLSKTKKLHNVLVDRYGERAIAYDTDRKVIVLLDTRTAKERRTDPATEKTVFRMSHGGNYYGILEPGAEEVCLYETYSGAKSSTLPATYSFRIDGERHTIKYRLKDFGFEEVVPTDNNLTVYMLALQEDRDAGTESVVQWGITYGEWRNTNRVYATLDQNFHFSPNGSLTEAGKAAMVK